MMQRFRIADSMVSVFWLLMIARAASLGPIHDIQLSSPSISSGLNVPSDFKVDVSTDCTVPIDSEDIYPTALKVMYDVSDIELDFTWLERDWSSPTGDSGIYLQNKDFGGKDPSRLQNRHIIWGLNHLLLSMTLSKRYCQTIAVLKWQSVAIGVLYVARRGSLGLGWGTQNQTDLLNLTQQQSNTMGVNELVDIAVEYLGNRPIDSEVIYLTAMKAMGEAAEKGLDEPVPALVTRGIRQITWRLVGRTAASPGILRARHSRIAVMKTVALMFQENKFQKIYVLVKVDGIPTAAGGFSQGDAESTTS